MRVTWGTQEASFDKSPKQGLSGVLEWIVIVGIGGGHREGTGTGATGVWRGEHTAAGGRGGSWEFPQQTAGAALR